MRIEYTSDAEADIGSAADQLVDGYGEALALKFRTRLAATLATVAAMPEAFAPVEPPFDRFPGLRVVPVKKFEARLILYTPTDTGILVVRVLPAASDWQSVLAEE